MMNVTETDIDESNPWADHPAAEGSRVCPAEGSEKARLAEGSKATGSKGSKGKMQKLAKKVTNFKDRIMPGKDRKKGKPRKKSRAGIPHGTRCAALALHPPVRHALQ